MSKTGFPEKIRSLMPHKCRFEATKMQGENCTIYFATYPPGTDIEPHTHDTDNWGVITKGRMNMIIDGESHFFGPGEWYHIPAHVEHCAKCDEETEEIEFWFKSGEKESEAA